MRYVRRKTKTNRSYRKRNTRYGRKSSRRTRSLGNPRQKVFFFKRFCNLTAITAAADGTDAWLPITFQLTQLPNYTDFTNLFDWYKINKIVVRLLPYFSQTNDDSGVSTFGPYSSAANLRIFTAIDTGTPPSGFGAGTAVNQIRQYENCKVTPYIRGQTRSFRPRYSDYQGTFEQVVGPTPWVDTQYPTAQYNGMLIAVDTSGLPPAMIASGDVLLRVEATYYISCKSVN